jgi:hypothetical protein
VSLFTKAQFDKLAEYGAATSDPLAQQLTVLSHNVDNFHRDSVRNDDGSLDSSKYAAIDVSGGVGAANPQGATEDDDSDSDGS